MKEEEKSEKRLRQRCHYRSSLQVKEGEERRGFGKPHNGLKWKGKNTTAN